VTHRVGEEHPAEVTGTARPIDEYITEYLERRQLTGESEPGTEPLNRERLGELLNGLAAPQGSYHLYGAHLDDAVVIDHRSQGWVVFQSERGGEFSLKLHHTEDAACRDLLTRLRRSFKL
jgi:hypothetical protein